ncbi:MAG: molybdenum cofactor biosynthesis protein MoaE [Anaerolineae bacterium]|nr:molybdenum cofactor biosynthesis protein MoaE [Anaerolineae bacterium]
MIVAAARRFEITEHVISADDVVARLVAPAVGGVVTFVGVVRDNSEGRKTLYLEYEAYPAMAEKVLQQIADEVRARWPEVLDVAIVHRVGRLEIGETAIVIALAAAHRAQLFDALRYAIDRIKEIAPIWKKEFYLDGAEWKSE